MCVASDSGPDLRRAGCVKQNLLFVLSVMIAPELLLKKNDFVSE